MLASWVLIFVSLAYIGGLFAIAYYGDKRADEGRSLINSPYIYALSLGVYCTAWTFYGSVGRAAEKGLGFLPIYLGPTLMAALWWVVLRKMIRISKVNRITSIADFIASRYGKSRLLGGLVTVIAVAGIVPYIALQLKAVSTSFNVLWHGANGGTQVPLTPFLSDTAFYVTIVLALFAILFGTRHLDVTEHHEGLVVAIAFESLVKLLAFLAVGLFVTFGFYEGVGDLFRQAQELPDLRQQFRLNDYEEWFWLTALSMMGILFLPRQFQMAVVENVNEEHLNKAIWLFPLYLFAINLFVLPIAIGGVLHFANDPTIDRDMFVLMLPLVAEQETLALLVFLGGLSAATGMVIVETVALSTMISNDLVMPILLEWRPEPGELPEVLNLEQGSRDLSGLLLAIRRVSIVLILLLGYAYFRVTGASFGLVSIGLISFAAVAQFAPAILGGMYWKGGTRIGALVGVTGGFLLWAYTLPLPSLVDSGWLSNSFVENGPFGIEWLKPYELFGLSGMNHISHALFWSLLVNVGSYVIVSLFGEQSILEQRQAALFVDVDQPKKGDNLRLWRSTASIFDLRSLMTRFLGAERVESLFSTYAQQNGADRLRDIADDDLIDFAEKALAGAVGAASARVIVASIVKEEAVGMDQVMQMLDETQEVIAYSQQLEEKSQALEAATTELRAANERLRATTGELTLANQRLTELDRLKDDFMSMVTHELRTPLTSIRGFGEILRDNPKLDITRRERFLNVIVEESERLTRLINNVLDLAKIERGAMEWELSPIDLAAVVEGSVAATSHLFEEKDIQLEVDLPQQVPEIIADQDKLVQVMLNLLSNAEKFTTDWVAVRLTQLPDALRVDVSDNGPGVKPEEQHIVFEKFRQVGDTLIDKPKGTGLGLPISRHIINHFGGQLWLESTPGEGATFSFTLPLTNGKHNR
ncbi:MAG: ATP-binding protein [Ardenticatenaceae bacterium]